MVEKIEVNVKFRIDDYARALDYLYNLSLGISFLYKHIYLVFSVLPFVLTLLAAIYYQNRFSITAFAITLAICVPASILIAFVIKTVRRNTSNPILKWYVSKQFNSTPSMQETENVIFDDEGIKVSSGLSHSETKWQAVTEMIESKQDFFFYTSKFYAQFVPKNAFINNEQQEQLRLLAVEKLGKKVKLDV